MSLIMMKTSQLSPLAFALYKTYCPAGIPAVAGLTQQQVQQNANLRNRQCCRCPTSSGHEGISLKLFVISSFIMSYETLSFPENLQVLKSYLAPIPY